MILPSLLHRFARFVERYRPALFSRIEWWFHLASMPVMLPIGAYFIMGERYFLDPITFTVGTIVNVFVYWYTVLLFTLAVRWVIRQFPLIQHAGIRLVSMLLLVGLIMAATAVLDLWLFSLVPGTGVRFSWDALVPLWLFGSVASPIFCLALGMFYVYSQWHDRQTENEQLKREAIQQQYDALKDRVNPHFLFNSLNSVSSLIGEDTAQAERFVDQLSMVYRYMLRANTQALVPLEEELNFLEIYADLLGVRYGSSLRLMPCISPDCRQGQLPPLTLQTLIDNAIKYNSMTPVRPLIIDIKTQADRLLISNTLQRKTIRVASGSAGLSTVILNYRRLNLPEPIAEETSTQFIVSLPLLTEL
ncbi:sensor histidine kinase [Spirosoma foliorum]|uniref:Histidine kinase n=1 Tax=Spirosoma foliorum TaxID=2710596 RepID=A0A7G5H191_9BACT|nr:histidine kinase [Spirosoma foliorum]QMW04883.1 histidine kinase [Spirosoma foliorum]